MKGIYVLIIELNHDISCRIRALGELAFQQGFYAYVGSAQNNLELRVKRHQRKEKRLFWHIDYLLNNEAARVTSVYHVPRRKAEECTVARLIQDNGALPVRGFGCSDCQCKSHLFMRKALNLLMIGCNLSKQIKGEIWVNS